MLLKTRAKEPTRKLSELPELEELEQELWQQYLELSRRVAWLDDGRSHREQGPEFKAAKTAQLQAHRRHQRVLEDILRLYRNDLFEQARLFDE